MNHSPSPTPPYPTSGRLILIDTNAAALHGLDGIAHQQHDQSDLAQTILGLRAVHTAHESQITLH
jgi:hypothetical protein